MNVLIPLVVLATAGNADTVLSELDRGSIRKKYIKTAPGSFTVSHVERLCRIELKRKPKADFVLLHVYGPTGGAPLPQPLHSDTYDYWRNMYEQIPKANEIAEMIAVENNAVLRMREATGQVVKRVLQGRDPLQIDMHGERYEILHIGFSRSSPYILQTATVFLQTKSSLEADRALEILWLLTPVFRDLKLSVIIANDSWFINVPGYPFSNPFIGDQTPPSPAGYRKPPALRCGYRTGGPSCISY